MWHSLMSKPLSPKVKHNVTTMHMNSQPAPFSRRSLRLSAFALAATLLAASSLSAVAQIGRVWTKRNPLPAGDSIRAVVAGTPATNPPVGGTRLVAVGGRGLILSSDDGITWTQRSATRLKNAAPAPVLEDLNGVIYANGRYLAVGDKATWVEGALTKNKATILTSQDGITWSDVSPDGAFDLNSAAYTNQFVAVGGAGTQGVTFFSANATTWSSATSAVPAGEFIDVFGLSGSLYSISTGVKGAILKGTFSGTTWVWAKMAVKSGLTATDVPLGLVYNGSRYVLVTKNAAGFDLWSSLVGENWAKCALGSASPALAVTRLALAGTEVIGVGTAGEVWKSADGANFSAVNRIPTGQPQNLLGAAKIGSTYVVTGEGGRIYTIAPPGETAWTSRYSSGSTFEINGVASNGTNFVGVGTNFSLTSSDATTWTEHAQTINMQSAVHTGSQYVAVGGGAWTSPDGITWTEVLAPFPAGTLNRVVWTGQYLVAVGSEGTAGNSHIQISDTGNAWTKITLPTGSNKPLRGAAFAGGLFVAVGDGGAVQTSPDFGNNWTKRQVVLLAGENFTDVVFGANLFIAVTNKGGVWTSPNGTAWTKRKASSPKGLNRIITVGTQVIALGDGGLEVFSFGGLGWSETEIGSSQNVKDAVFAASQIVAVGSTGLIATSSGSTPARPTLNFALGTDQVSESVVGGTKQVVLNLSPASSIPVTVLFTTSGTALRGVAATSDYNVPVTPVLFNPGETTKQIAVAVKSDTVDEVDETAVFSLGAATGDAALGATSVHTLTIQDDDQIPTFTLQPLSGILNVGASAELIATVAASGTIAPPATLTATWKKGAAVASLTQTNLVVASPAGATFKGAISPVKLTDAGDYTVAVKNPAGTTTSAVARIAVVDPTPVSLAAGADTTVTIQAKFGGTGLAFQWMKDGNDIHNSTDGRIFGTDTSKLTIKNCDLGDVGTYTCKVYLTTNSGTLMAPTTPTTLTVLTTVPGITSTSLGTTSVALPYTFTPAATGSPSQWTITGLPAGLTYSTSTGVISGKVTASVTAPGGVDVNVLVKAKNILGEGPARTLVLHVNPLPANAINSWTGLLERNADANGALGGRFELTVAASGSYTGRLQRGTHTTNLAGSVTLNLTGPVVTLSQAIPAIGVLPAVTLNVTIDPVTQTLTASTSTAGNVSTANITGWRSNLWAGAPPVNSQGLYNFVINPTVSPTVGNPRGYGYGTFTVAADGSYNLTGKTADGTAYSMTGVMGKTVVSGVNEIQVYAGMFTIAPGSLHGTLTLTEVLDSGNYRKNKISGDLTWMKPDQGTVIAASAPDKRTYGAGFGVPTPLVHVTDGGRYYDPADPVNMPPNTGPSANQAHVFAGVKPTASNAALRFNLGPTSPYPHLTTYNPDIVVGITAPSSAVVPSGLSANPGAVSLVINGPTGVFSGGMTLTELDTFGKTCTRKPKFFGIVIRPQGDSPVVQNYPFLEAKGTTLIERLPESGFSGPTTVGDTGNGAIESIPVTMVRNT